MDASGTEASSVARPRSEAISSGIGADLSASTPAGSPTTTKGRNSAAASSPTSSGVARSSRMAISGSASAVTPVPPSLTLSAAHSRRKGPLAQVPVLITASLDQAAELGRWHRGRRARQPHRDGGATTGGAGRPHGAPVSFDNRPDDGQAQT